MFTQQEFNWLVSICNIRSTLCRMSSGHWLSTVSYLRCCIGVLIPRRQFTFSGLLGLIKDIRQSPADPQPSGLITPGNFCNYCKERVKRYRTFFTLLHFDILHSTDVTGRCWLGGIVLDTFSIHWLASHNWNSILLSKVLKILSYVWHDWVVISYDALSDNKISWIFHNFWIWIWWDRLRRVQLSK